MRFAVPEPGPLPSAPAESPKRLGKESENRSQGSFWSTHVVILQQGDAMSDTHQIELGSEFLPKFDAQGLLAAVAVDAASGEVLMVAFMDAEALAKTRETGLAHFHSRSRGRLWMKGETSGHVLKVREIRVDCDQDALVLLVEAAGPACHTGATSCFYRRLNGEGLAPLTD
jgi:phosphoribosyl-AMP cyclohydrolase